MCSNDSMMNATPAPKAFSFSTVLHGILPDLTRQVTHTPPLLAEPGVFGLAYLFLELSLLIIIGAVRRIVILAH